MLHLGQNYYTMKNNILGCFLSVNGETNEYMFVLERAQFEQKGVVKRESEKGNTIDIDNDTKYYFRFVGSDEIYSFLCHGRDCDMADYRMDGK